MDLRNASSSRDTAATYGISEWQCWYYHYDLPKDPPHAVVDTCVDAHLAAGINHLVWNAGRSTLDYHSALPGSTRLFKQTGPKTDPDKKAFIDAVFEVGCPLRRAQARCREAGVPLLARLCMNRHYGIDASPENTSRFASEHPEYWERDRAGQQNTSRLCYAFEAVRRERIDILLELQQIGVDGLVLDFCRQMPLLRYHSALVEPFIEQEKVDPRIIDSAEPEAFESWFRYRAGIMTNFMRELRQALRSAGDCDCPLIVRVPDGSEWLMIAYGLDLRTWLADDLIDAVMLSPFPITVQDLDRHYAFHAELAHQYGKSCIGGLGSRGLMLPDGVSGRRALDPVPEKAYEVMHQQFAAGCDAMSIYQTETLARLASLQPILQAAGDPGLVAERAAALTEEQRRDLGQVGIDWHAFRHGLYGVGNSVQPEQAI